MKKAVFGFIIIALFCCVFLSACDRTGKEKLTISYYDGDVLLQRQAYTDEITPITPEKDGYTFVGWYLDKSFKKSFDPAEKSEYFKSGTLDFYAKWERIMRIEGVTKENQVVLNPIFEWSAVSGDAVYQISLISEGETLFEAETRKTFFRPTELLAGDTDYVFTVIGIDSEEESAVSFHTASEGESAIKKITLSNPYSDHMMLQRGKETVFGGVGPIHQLITLSIGKEEYYGVSDATGAFEVILPAKNASFTPTEILFTNSFGVEKKISDVLFGDVYLFAGQSNMQWSTRDSDYLQSDLDSLYASKVRFFCQDPRSSETKRDSVTNGRWFVPSKDGSDCKGFSAITTMSASFLASMVNDETPIGMITAYQGDTNIAEWLGEEYYTGTMSKKNQRYNAMVYPLSRANLCGVVWYQGCNNASAGCEYKDLLKSLFRNYRDLFGSKDLPFFVIGLACYDGDSGNNYDFAYVRESQAKACEEDENAYFISICDDGDPTYIHPKAKRYVCDRVAKSIASVCYGKNYCAEGPAYLSHTVEGSMVTITLKNAEGLRAEGTIQGFYLAGADGKYHHANAVIREGKIVASSEKVAAPVYVKYGFARSPFVNIFNKDGFAITPFRTDDLNENIDLFEYDSLDNYDFHAEGSHMDISLVDGKLSVSKANDGVGFGSVRLYYWGAIAYQPEKFRFTLNGANSGAKVTFRFAEGNGEEIWGYSVTDDFEGEKTFTVNVSDIKVLYSWGGKYANDLFETQKIGFVEMMIERNGSSTIELLEARFIK